MVMMHIGWRFSRAPPPAHKILAMNVHASDRKPQIHLLYLPEPHVHPFLDPIVRVWIASTAGWLQWAPSSSHGETSQ